MTQNPHILLVEDDRDISTLLQRFLQGHDCRVSLARNGRDMDRVIADSRVDMIVLDLMLPGEDGLSLCRRLRAASRIPIVILSAKGEELDRIVGLEIGADDYVAKPFNPRELLARIRAVLRRASDASDLNGADEPKVMVFLDWTLDALHRTLRSPEGAQVALTGAEFDLLHVFCQRPRRILTREQLIELTHRRAAMPTERSIDILVARLRRKIEAVPGAPEIIRTVRSGGYLFTPEVTAS